MPQTFAKIYKSAKKYSPDRDISGKHEVLSTVQVDFEGRQVSQSQYIIDDPRERYKGLKPEDFALENQIAVGVEAKPALCSFQRASIESEIERVNNLSIEQVEQVKS